MGRRVYTLTPFLLVRTKQKKSAVGGVVFYISGGDRKRWRHGAIFAEVDEYELFGTKTDGATDGAIGAIIPATWRQRTVDRGQRSEVGGRPS